MTAKKELAVPQPASTAEAITTSLEAMAAPLLATERIEANQIDWANDVANKMKQAQRVIRGERKHATELRRLANQFDKPWKAADDVCSKVISHSSSLILRQRREAEEAQRAILEAVAAQQAPREALVEARTLVQDTPEGFHEVTTWEYEIIDESQIPREYFVLDHARIAREVRAQKAQLTIPGVRVFSSKAGRRR